MKTAEEIFEEFYSEAFKNSPIALKLAFKEACIKVAIKYSNQKLDEAYFSCNLIHSFDDESKPEFIETYNTQLGVIAPNLQSILSLKDKI